MRFVAILFLMAALAAGRPAIAADPAPDPAVAAQAPWAAKPPPKLPDEMFLTLDRFRYYIDCIATDEWADARGLFDTRIGSAAQEAILTRLTGGVNGTPCSYVERMRMTSTIMRGGIAEARYRYAYVRNAPPPPPMSADVAPAPAGASFAWVGFNKESGDGAIYVFANCLAEKEPGGVQAVLTTRWGQKEERAAYQALSRRFGECLRPGEALKANSLTLRPWLGEAAYQHARRLKPDA